MIRIENLNSLTSRPACYRAAVQEEIRRRTLAGATLVGAIREIRTELSVQEATYRRNGGESELVIFCGLTNALLAIQEGH